MRSVGLEITGAGEGIRTSDLLITSQLLYQLSYTGDKWPDEADRRLLYRNDEDCQS